MLADTYWCWVRKRTVLWTGLFFSLAATSPSFIFDIDPAVTSPSEGLLWRPPWRHTNTKAFVTFFCLKCKSRGVREPTHQLHRLQPRGATTCNHPATETKAAVRRRPLHILHFARHQAKPACFFTLFHITALL